MALPTSGPLSFTDIAGELSVSSPYSLRNMSVEANFSTPDAVSDFYGYDAGGGPTLIQFWITGVSDVDPLDRCFLTTSDPAWHTGLSGTPGIGDMVYLDSGGNDALKAGYYGFSEDKFGAAKSSMEVAPGGAVSNLYQC